MARIYVPKPYNPAINWDNPLTEGLQMDWILSEGGGLSPRDLVARSKLTVTNADWLRRFGDVGLNFDASGESATKTDVPPFQRYKAHGRMSVEVEFTRDTGGSGTAYGCLMGTGTSAVFGGRQWLLENDNGDSGWGFHFQVWWDSQPGIWSIPYPAAGIKHHLIITYDGSSTGNDPTFFYDGKVIAGTERLNPVGTLRTGGAYLTLGNLPEGGSAMDGSVFRTRVWDRLLTLREQMMLSRDPYQIYRRSVPFGKAAAAVNVTVNADVVSGSFSAPDPVVTGGATVSSDVVSVAGSVPDPTITVNSTDVTADAEYVSAQFRVLDPIVKDTSVPIHKHYFYKVYDAGVYLTTWSQEVISLPSFRMNINGGAGELRVKLAREFDSFGEDEDVKLNNTVECYVADKENPNGLLLYSGYISGYKPVLDKADEHIDITLFSFVAQLQFLMLRDSGGTTTLTYNSYDPADILRDVIDKLRALGSSLSYTSTSIQNTNTLVSYTFNTNTGKECIDKIVELCPEGWFWRVDPDNVIHLKPKNVLSDHAFILGKHIEKLETYRRIEDLVNTVFFTGGGSPKLFKKFENTSSQDTYGKHEKKIVDERVTVTATALAMATRILNAQKDPEIRSNFEIVDSNGPGLHGYDIETIKVGHTLKVLNLKSGQKTITLWDVGFWDIDVWDQTLATSAADVIQILSLMYEPDSIKIEASSRIPQIAKRVEDINRNVENSQTVDNPSAPS